MKEKKTSRDTNLKL